MDIKDYIFEKSLLYGAEAADMESAIDLLIDMHSKAGNISDKEEYKRAVLEREAREPTALLDGAAIPHAYCKGVRRASLACVKLRNPVSWGGKSVDKIYMLASPDSASHLELLSALADALQNGRDIV